MTSAVRIVRMLWIAL